MYSLRRPKSEFVTQIWNAVRNAQVCALELDFVADVWHLTHWHLVQATANLIVANVVVREA
jgi:hypothetical protein